MEKYFSQIGTVNRQILNDVPLSSCQVKDSRDELLRRLARPYESVAVHASGTALAERLDESL
jgi:hypothetical protein